MLNKLKKIKAFTILEITIVIVIIGVLMAATMKFGGDRIGLLNNKNIQEQFIDSYSVLQSKNNMTNYYIGNMYQDLIINFNLGKNYIDYQYNSNEYVLTGRTYVEGGNYQIDYLMLDGEDVESANVYMIPYVFGCSIGDNSSELIIGILVNNSRKYCFSIQSGNCRIRNVLCDLVSSR